MRIEVLEDESILEDFPDTNYVLNDQKDKK